MFEKEAQELANQRLSEKKFKYTEYKINKSLLIGKLKDDLIEILLEDDNHIKNNRFNQLIKDMSRYVVPVRPGRSYERKKASSNKNSRSRKRCF